MNCPTLHNITEAWTQNRVRFEPNSLWIIDVANLYYFSLSFSEKIMDITNTIKKAIEQAIYIAHSSEYIELLYAYTVLNVGITSPDSDIS